VCVPGDRAAGRFLYIFSSPSVSDTRDDAQRTSAQTYMLHMYATPAPGTGPDPDRRPSVRFGSCQRYMDHFAGACGEGPKGMIEPGRGSRIISHRAAVKFGREQEKEART
jgi:hypothetical protein